MFYEPYDCHRFHLGECGALCCGSTVEALEFWIADVLNPLLPEGEQIAADDIDATRGQDLPNGLWICGVYLDWETQCFGLEELETTVKLMVAATLADLDVLFGLLNVQMPACQVAA